jgi:hypothetical protein
MCASSKFLKYLTKGGYNQLDSHIIMDRACAQISDILICGKVVYVL